MYLSFFFIIISFNFYFIYKPLTFLCFRYDRQLQSIVDKIFPELEKKDAIAEREFYKERGIPFVEAISTFFRFRNLEFCAFYKFSKFVKK